jgi:hypothetical protein
LFFAGKLPWFVQHCKVVFFKLYATIYFGCKRLRSGSLRNQNICDLPPMKMSMMFLKQTESIFLHKMVCQQPCSFPVDEARVDVSAVTSEPFKDAYYFARFTLHKALTPAIS